MIAFASILAFLIACWMALRLQDPASRLHILDHPNERSLHDVPTPRSGGVAVIVATLIGWALFGGYLLPGFAWLLAAVLLLWGVGLWDDLGHLAARYRLTAHLIAGLLVIGGGYQSVVFPLPFSDPLTLPRVAAIGFTLLFLVWMINLYNFMDGMDGLAGGMGVFGFGGLALAGAMVGDGLFVGLNLMVVAGLLGFLVWNLPKASIFLGDAGSSVLGLLAGAFSVIGEVRGAAPLWAGILLFSPFIFDATLTLLHRALRKEKVWEAHRDHLFQRLVTAGWTTRRTLGWAYGIMAVALLATLAAVRDPALAWWMIAGLGSLYGGVALAVHQRLSLISIPSERSLR